MTLKEIIDKEFEVISESKIKDKKHVKIYYKLNLNLIKPQQEQENNVEKQQEVTQQPDNNQNQQPEQQAQQTNDMSAQQGTADLNQETNPEVNPNIPLASVYTEDEKIDDNSTENKTIKIQDDNSVVRKIEGTVELQKEKIDEIQTFQDIIAYLSTERVEGVQILDEFSSEIINMIFTPEANQINQKVDKKSSIFLDIKYGFEENDNVGVRIKKVANSDIISNVMVIDGEIINAPFNLSKVNERIIDYRNSSFVKNN